MAAKNDADGSIVQNTILVWYGRHTISIHTIQCPELLQQFGKALYHGFDFTLDILFFFIEVEPGTGWPWYVATLPPGNN